MKVPGIIVSLKTRARRPATFAALVVFSVPFIIFRVLLYRNEHLTHPITWVGAFTVPILIALAYALLSAAPWLWTGDERVGASLGRGVWQSLIFNTLIVSLLVVLDGLSIFASHPAHPMSMRVAWYLNLLLLVPSMSVIGFFIASGERTEREKREAMAKAQEAQWVLLRGQLSPHVLFNALNGLAELVHQDPKAAEQALLDLAGLYRALLDHGDRVEAPLEDERNLVTQYLGVESMRLGGRLKVIWDWDTSLNAVSAPPFLIQPLVENALKHGIAASPGGGELRIHLSQDGQGLLLRVENTGRPMRLVLGNGVGLRNLEARLALAYAEDAHFRLFSDGDRTVAELRLPMSKDIA